VLPAAGLGQPLLAYVYELKGFGDLQGVGPLRLRDIPRTPPRPLLETRPSLPPSPQLQVTLVPDPRPGLASPSGLRLIVSEFDTGQLVEVGGEKTQSRTHARAHKHTHRPLTRSRTPHTHTHTHTRTRARTHTEAE